MELHPRPVDIDPGDTYIRRNMQLERTVKYPHGSAVEG